MNKEENNYSIIDEFNDKDKEFIEVLNSLNLDIFESFDNVNNSIIMRHNKMYSIPQKHFDYMKVKKNIDIDFDYIPESIFKKDILPQYSSNQYSFYKAKK